MKTKNIIKTALPAVLCLSMLSACSGKQPERAVFRPSEKPVSSTLPEDMAEEIAKDYETVKEPDEPQNEDAKEDVMPLTHLSSTEDLKEMENSKNSDVITINEKVFITQINDIYYNFEDYENKTIVVEGIFSIFESYVSDATAPVVYRNGPGCCNNDGWAGFLLKYDGKLPKENDWIRVKGTPFLDHTEEGYTNLYLTVTSLEVLEKRGAETVAQ